jgi:hypothetical protein
VAGRSGRGTGTGAAPGVPNARDQRGDAWRQPPGRAACGALAGAPAPDARGVGIL